MSTWRLRVRAAVLVLLMAIAFGPAVAHKASDAYLQLARGQAGATLRADVALRDLDLAIPIDADDDARITWGEVRAAWPAIAAYLGERITLEGCALRAGGPRLERRNDGAYAAMEFAADCAPAMAPRIGYRVLAEDDPTHRGILRIDWPGMAPVVEVLDPTSPALASIGQPAAAPTSFVAEGIHHIVTGYDHVLFLLCLLLPAVMRRSPGGWVPVARLREAIVPVAGIVTAFTLAHSITLALAASKLVTMPAWVIEPAIAVTIGLAAFDNLRPIFGGHRSLVTFFFGLVHGFGFANVLGELDLPGLPFAWALFRFNLGLELGQIAIVAAVAAALYLLRERPGYPRWVIGSGSAAAIGMAMLWLIERTTATPLLPL